MNIVILAGGGGTRLWPMSRGSNPKQFSSLVSNLSMFEETFNRFKKDYPIDKIYVSVTKQNAIIAQKILPEISKNHYIIEPEKRDTGPAMAYVAAYLACNANPKEPVAFIPSDHYIKNVSDFINAIKQTEKIILKTGKMVDIGIKPEFPNDNLGYTKIGKIVKELDGVKFYEFKGQTEKPKLEVAKAYIKSGDYLWHANFFMWTPEKFLQAYQKYAPEIYEPIEKIIKTLKQKNIKTKEKDKIIKREFRKTEKISIDYAVAEKMDQKEVLIIKGEFGWSDFGSWSMIYDQLKDSTDNHGNLIKANFVHKDTKNCLVYGQKDKLIATIGVEDLAIVDTADALLVCRKDRAQDVKKIVEMLKKQGKIKYL